MRPSIKNYRHGSVSPDGNGMTGGRWWGCERLGYRCVSISEQLDPSISDERYKEISEWFYAKNYDDVVIEAYIELSEDTSTNYSGCEIDEVFYPEEFDKRINECPLLTDDEKAKAINDFNKYVDGLEACDFDLYEL